MPAKSLSTEKKGAKLEDAREMFNRGFEFDRRLFRAAVKINLAYCDALFHAGILTRLESERIKNGLQTILKRADYYQDYFDQTAADVHSFIEIRLAQLIGEAAEKINVGRSRDEQSLTAFRLCLREEIEEISSGIRNLQSVLIGAAELQKDAVFPAFANSQKAQPILWAHWCLAYFEMFARDRERLDEVWRRVNVLPLGAADLAGTFIEIDREEIARALGFEGISANSLDAVGDADFAIESIGACALTMIHLSRLAEDLIFYNSTEFNFFEAASSFEKSSFAAEKTNNINVLEIVRSQAGKIFGHQTALNTTLKSLSLGIHSDFLQVEETVFDAVDTLKSCLRAISMVLEKPRLNEKRTLEFVTKNHYGANEIIDYLVQRDVPPKSAEKITGEIVSFAVARGKTLRELSLAEFQKFAAQFSEDVFQALTLEQTLASKNQIGGTSPERVFEALEQAKENLERENPDFVG